MTNITAKRKPRADGLRNRDLIVATARAAWAEGGSEVTLEEIVRRAGLGVGTLYRHFPTRDALVEAVYLSEVEKMAEAERELTATLPPVEALRQWMLLFVDFLATKIAMRDALNGMIGGTTELYACSGELVRSAMGNLTSRAIEAGEIRLEFEPLDLLRAVSGISSTSVNPNWPESARRLVDVLIAGIQTQPGARDPQSTSESTSRR